MLSIQVFALHVRDSRFQLLLCYLVAVNELEKTIVYCTVLYCRDNKLPRAHTCNHYMPRYHMVMIQCASRLND